MGPGLETAAAGKVVGRTVVVNTTDVVQRLEPATVPIVGMEVRSRAATNGEVGNMAAGTRSAGGIEVAVAVAGLAMMAADTVAAAKRQV